MTPETWNQVMEIFSAVAELEPGAQEEFIRLHSPNERITEQVRKLLAADQASDDFLEEPVAVVTPIPERIGQYRIVEKIGGGGMGVVYLGEKPDVGKKIAVKLIRRGFDSSVLLRRFHQERRILASLDHPNIAGLIDGGTAEDGQPFYVMEYVAGTAIDHFCRDMSTNDILRLFRKVCDAVEYAHRRLVVHRDLKPSNILVTPDGTPKLLDFGIAKLLSNDTGPDPGTATTFGMMSLNYASPEQIKGETATTATDIYSLGVILYQLLTGRVIYDFRGMGVDKILTVLEADSPERPRAAAQSASGRSDIADDLENIVMKSVQLDPSRRYGSVRELSDDIENYLHGRPVTARTDSFAYRARKFVTRNRISVTAAGLVLASLIAGISIATWQAVVARRQRALAERRFSEVRDLANKVLFRYHDEIAKFPGSTALREELVNDAIKYLDSLNQDEIDDPKLKIELATAYEKIADVQGQPYAPNVGKDNDALLNYQKAETIARTLVTQFEDSVEFKRDLIRIQRKTASIMARLSTESRAEIINDVVRLQSAVNEQTPADSIRNAIDSAQAFILAGDYIDGTTVSRIDWYQRAFDLLDPIEPKDTETRHQFTRVTQRLGTSFTRHGDELLATGEVEASKAEYGRALGMNVRLFESVQAEIAAEPESANSWRILSSAHKNLGESYSRTGIHNRAIENLEASLRIRLQISDADPGNREARLDLADSYEALSLAQDAAGLRSAALGTNLLAYRTVESVNEGSDRNEETVQLLAKYGIARLYMLRGVPRDAENSKFAEEFERFCGTPYAKGYCLFERSQRSW